MAHTINHLSTRAPVVGVHEWIDYAQAVWALPTVTAEEAEWLSQRFAAEHRVTRTALPPRTEPTAVVSLALLGTHAP